MFNEPPSKYLLYENIPIWEEDLTEDVGVCVQLLNHVQLCNPVDCSPPGSSVHGILQAKMLEGVAISSSRESFCSRNRTLHWQVDSSPLSNLGSPFEKTEVSLIMQSARPQRTVSPLSAVTILQNVPAVSLMPHRASDRQRNWFC
ncbi:unnamed protein product [Rangifer tarandus platyrhynchus]|uniref:Uncharacterized protein n=1 Tax=Rangifer tarandus platyrhynchus TaxID=3082113 RepID=A0AC60A5D3_RANTA